MTDLAARVLAAIAEAERIAEAAALYHPTPWRLDPEVETTMVTGRWVADARSDGVLVANGDGPARFIAANDPAVVLRRCAADRRIATRHSLRGKSVLRHGEFVDYCAACDNPIPCPDLLDQALAHGVEPWCRTGGGPV